MGFQQSKIPARAPLRFPSYNNEQDLLRQKEEIQGAVGNMARVAQELLARGAVVVVAPQMLISAIPFAFKAIDFILNRYSLESALMTYKIKGEVMKSVIDFIMCKISTIKTSLDLVFRRGITRQEMEREITNAERDCREILEHFKGNRTLNEWPFPSAPILVNFTQIYIDVVILYLSFSPSQAMADYLKNIITVDLVSTIKDYQRRCVEQRLEAIVVTEGVSAFKEPVCWLRGRDKFDDEFVIKISEPGCTFKISETRGKVRVYRENVRVVYHDYFNAALQSIENFRSQS